MQQEQEVTAGRASAQRICNACIKMIFKGFVNVLSEQWWKRNLSHDVTH